MRITSIISALIVFLALMSCTVFINIVSAACLPTSPSGGCTGRCGVVTMTYSHTLNDNEDGCPSGQCVTYNCYDNSQNCQTPNGDPYDWCPEGYNNTACSPIQCQDCNVVVGGSSCVYETSEVYCDCAPTTAPTPQPTDSSGGGEPTPTEPPAAPTTNPLIQGSIQEDVSAALSGAYCTQATSSPLDLSGAVVRANKDGNSYVATFGFAVPSNYSINTTQTGTDYAVILNLTNQVGTNYVCSCPGPIDPSDPYRCRYSGVTSPLANVNFYLKEYNLSNSSWFQIFGGNLFALGSITTDVPATFCATDGNCVAALMAPMPSSSTELSGGFPITYSGNNNNLQSSDTSSEYHSYFHEATRLTNVNSYALSSNLNQNSYDYFYSLAEDSIQTIGNGEDTEPLLADFTNAAWWQASDINYVHIDGNVSIDETQGFNLSSGQQLVVFVEGNLTLDDSNPNDTSRKITSVANGGFLAFIVSGNILITPNVGYELDPLAPTAPTVNNTNANLEGVFLANGTLTSQSKSAVGEVPPDKKLIAAGTFVGWGGVNLNRTFDDNNFGPILNNNQAIENFIYRPDLLVNWPTKLKTSLSNWREVDPQLISQ